MISTANAYAQRPQLSVWDFDCWDKTLANSLSTRTALFLRDIRYHGHRSR